jgi:hypothetical protein
MQELHVSSPICGQDPTTALGPFLRLSVVTYG